MSDLKAELRRRSLARRDLIAPHEAHEAAASVARRGVALVADFARDAKLSAPPVVSVYWPIRSELNTRPLIDALAAEGYRVTLPVMHKVRHPLVFRAFAPGDDLVKGPFGLSEPSDDKPAYDPDIVFSPLAAFDRRGFRSAMAVASMTPRSLPFAPISRSSPSASPIPARKPTMCRSNRMTSGSTPS